MRQEVSVGAVIIAPHPFLLAPVVTLRATRPRYIMCHHFTPAAVYHLHDFVPLQMSALKSTSSASSALRFSASVKSLPSSSPPNPFFRVKDLKLTATARLCGRLGVLRFWTNSLCNSMRFGMQFNRFPLVGCLFGCVHGGAPSDVTQFLEMDSDDFDSGSGSTSCSTLASTSSDSFDSATYSSAQKRMLLRQRCV